jgi:hypothetical protein
MSCETASNRISKLAGQISAGIAGLSNKQAFFAGVAVGASGAGLGSLAVARRQKLANFFRRLTDKKSDTPPRQAVPVTGPGPARSGAKPKPRPIPGLASPSRQPKKAKPIPGLPAKQTKTIPILANPSNSAPQTKLQAASIPMQDGQGQTYTPQNSYRVLRPDGSDTGLAITPYLEQGENRQVAEKVGAWGVTHTGTGALLDGPFPSISQAQGLATELSTLRWTAARVPKADVDQARQMIGQYRQSLAEKGG